LLILVASEALFERTGFFHITASSRLWQLTELPACRNVAGPWVHPAAIVLLIELMGTGGHRAAVIL
jgi:hypothetical protein